MNKWTLMIQKNLMIPSYLMIQREFRLEVGTLIIQKSKVIPPSSMVSFNFAFVILFVFLFMLCLGGMG